MTHIRFFPVDVTDDTLMQLALQQAQQAAAQGEVPVGAVLVQRQADQVEVLAMAHNQPVGLSDPTAHAEMLALRAAAQQQRNYRLDGCELFVTLEPCAMCAQALMHARVKRVVFGAHEPKTGAAGSVLNLFNFPTLNHHTQVESGVLAAECAKGLQSFFQQRRAQHKRNARPLRDDALRTPPQVFEPVWQSYPELLSKRVVLTDVPALQGLCLHLLDLGERASQATLCLHGPEGWWPQCVDWAYAQVPARGRVVLPDLIGFGQSDKPKKTAWHSLQQHASVLWQSLQALGVERFDVAWAPGQAQLAQQLQRCAPSAVGRLHPIPPAALVRLGEDWCKLPYPDAGHRAGPHAWKQYGWSQDEVLPAE